MSWTFTKLIENQCGMFVCKPTDRQVNVTNDKIPSNDAIKIYNELTTDMLLLTNIWQPISVHSVKILKLF